MLRTLTSHDLDTICRHRDLMFREAGRDNLSLRAMAQPFRDWLAPRLTDGSYFGFMAELESQIAGGIGLMEIEWPPHPSHPQDSRRGYVLNLYVEPTFRRQGIGRTLMEAAEREFKQRNLSYLVLHATQVGVPLYESLGWNRTSEMAKPMTA